MVNNIEKTIPINTKRAKKSCIELSVIPKKISFVEAVLKIAAKIELNPYKIVKKTTKNINFDWKKVLYNNQPSGKTPTP